MIEPVLQLDGITKEFPGVLALDNVSLSIHSGEVHALLGENGAGKSTVVNLVAGVYKPDSGQIVLEGQPVRFSAPEESMTQGIAFIYQELTLLPSLSVAENIFVGRLPRRRGVPLVDWGELRIRAKEVLGRIGLDLDPDVPVSYLSTGLQQQVEICRALALNPRILVMDEPTSALTEHEVERLFETVRTLSAEGLTVIFISHRLEEVNQIAQRLTVLRDGRVVLTKEVAGITPQELAEAMLGHVLESASSTQSGTDAPALTLRNLTSAGRFENITMEVCQGEIVGIAGLLGAGKTELLRAVYGADLIDSGEILIEGEPFTPQSPRAAIREGVFLVPEDRKLEGLVLGMSVSENMTLPYLGQLARAGFISYGEQAALVNSFIEKINIKTPNAAQRVINLSGGNQQKVILARWLSMKPKVLLLDQPTRGLDIGAKEEIYHLVLQLAESGVAIVFVATEIPELLRVSNRIFVMRDGKIVDELEAANCSEQDIFLASVGG